MKKVVVKLDLQDDKAKQKALKTASTLPGIDSISMDMKGKKLTVIGSVDPVKVVSKLRKYWQTDIITVGPAKQPEKKEEPKKEEGKKEEPKKEEGKKEEPKKEEDGKKEEPKKEGDGKKEETKKEGDGKKEEPKKEEGGKKGDPKKEEEKKPDPVLEHVRAYRAYNPHMTYYHAHSMEENPNACVIC